MSARRARLKELGIELPLLPTTSVGSFPKPKSITKGWDRLAAGEITTEEMHRLEEEATIEMLRLQEQAGLDILVDGEMYREDMVVHFAQNLDGWELGGQVRAYGNSFYRKPIITGEVRWRGPITVDWWKFAQGKTKRPVKGMITGPYTVMDWAFDEHYPTRKDACFALARELAKEVDALIAAGCRIIQVDEPALSVRPEELPWAIEAIGKVTKGREAYFITHICYGALEKIYPDVLDVPVDNFDLELSNSDLDLLDLFKKNPFTKDLSFGVVDAHSHKVEEVALIAKRIRRALEVLAPEQVWIDPDCGLKTRSHEEAWGKMQNIVAATREVRAGLPPP